MRSESVGPPKQRMKNREGKRQVVSPGDKLDLLASYYCLGCAVVYDQSCLRICCCDNLYVGLELGNIYADLFLHNMQISDAQFVPGLNSDSLPDAARNKTRAPIPAELISSFACIGVGFLALVVG